MLKVELMADIGKHINIFWGWRDGSAASTGCSIPSTHTVAQNHLYVQFKGNQSLLLAFTGTRLIYV